jgi:hypothetical protein
MLFVRFRSPLYLNEAESPGLTLPFPSDMPPTVAIRDVVQAYTEGSPRCATREYRTISPYMQIFFLDYSMFYTLMCRYEIGEMSWRKGHAGEDHRHCQ